jgi:MtN3 and saliva related transmembrane protein
MNFTTIIGLVASVFTGISLLPQLIKLIKEKEPKDISYGMLSFLFIGLSSWTYYGFLKEDWIIIISNAFSLLVNLCIVIFSVKYNKHKSG